MSAAMQKPNLAKLDILVIDPSPHMGSLVGQMLRHLRVRQVDEVDNSDQAIVLLQSHRYSAIMLNDVLQPMDGVAVARTLRHASAGLNRDTPIIMMSSEPSAAGIAEARDAGVTEFLRKPFATQDIQTRLASLLSSPRAFIEAAAYAGPDRRRRRAQRSTPGRREGETPPE